MRNYNPKFKILHPTPDPSPKERGARNPYPWGKGLGWGFLVLVFAFCLLSSPLQTLAQDSYQLLAPLPGLPTTLAEKNILGEYLPAIFRLAIGLATVFAVLMIVLGGFRYMSADAFQKKEEGKKMVENAIKGLILVIAAWLILWTINPDLLTLNLNISPAKVSAPPTVKIVDSSEIQPELEYALIGLASVCVDCHITVTSTTEGTHSTGSLHYQGLAADLAPDTKLTEFITDSADEPAACTVFTKVLGGQSARFLWEPEGVACGTEPSSGDHWHMSVSP